MVTTYLEPRSRGVAYHGLTGAEAGILPKTDIIIFLKLNNTIYPIYQTRHTLLNLCQQTLILVQAFICLPNSKL